MSHMCKNGTHKKSQVMKIDFCKVVQDEYKIAFNNELLWQLW